MLKKTITYTDFDGVEQTETHYFHLGKHELLEVEALAEGGSFSDLLVKIIETKDNKTLLSLFKNLVLMSYGVRSDDGRRFIKSDEMREEFSQTAAFDEIYIELAMDAQVAADFVNGIIPANLPSDKPGAVPDLGDLTKKTPEELAEMIRALKTQPSA